MLDFGLVREALEERGLLLTRLAPHLVRPVPFLYPLDPPRLGAAVRRSGPGALRRDGDGREVRHGRAPAPAPDPPQVRCGSRPTCGPTPWSARSATTTRRSTTPGYVMTVARTAADARRARRHPDQGGRLPARGRAGHRCPGRRPGDRSRDRRPGAGGGQRRRRLDRRHPGARRRPRVAQRPGQQGHPPRRAARPDPLRDRADPAHREVRAVRDPVGPALDHRHHRHPVGPGQGAPGRVARGHRLPARPRQRGAQGAARPTTTSRASTPGCGRWRPGSPSRPAGSPASTPSWRRCPGW